MRARASPRAPGLRQARPLLVTGGAGFIGCNLADRLASEGHDVIVLDGLTRAGVEENLHWLKRRHNTRLTVIIGDIRDAGAADIVADAAGVFHLAAQVAVTTSLNDPQADLDVNLGGTVNLLEAVRRRATTIPFVFASTNKVYGDLSDLQLESAPEAYHPIDAAACGHGIDEQQPLCFHTPYGCSKGAADQYVLDYAHTFGLRSAVLRMSCIYGPHQRGTEDQGWVAHFLISALKGRPITIYGDGRQVRDILYVDDAVEAYVRALRRIDAIRGRAFNLGGGPANAVSLRQVLARIEYLLGRAVDVGFAEWRPGDQRYYVSDTRAVSAALELPKPRGWESGIAQLASWLTDTRGRSTAALADCPPAQARP